MSDSVSFWWFRVGRSRAVGAVFVAGVAACLISGTMYAVSLWLPQLKESLLWTQTQSNVIASSGSLGQYLGFLSGLLHDKTSARTTLLAGGLAASTGYAVLAIGAHLQSCPFWAAAICMFVVGLGQFATFTAGYAPSTVNVGPARRSRTMGAMLIGFAASSLVFSLFFMLFSSTAGFLLLVSLSILCVSLLAASIVRVVPSAEQIEAASDVELVGPKKMQESVDMEIVPEETSGDLVDSKAEQSVDQEAPSPAVAVVAAMEQRGDVSPLEALKRADFLLLMLILALINGPGLFWIMVQGSAARSLLMDSSANLVIVLACGSIAGRFIISFASDGLGAKLARSWLLLPCAFMMSLTMGLFAFVQSQPMLYVTSALVGASYGMCYVIVTTVCSLWFGTKWIATNNGIMSVGTAFIVFALGFLNGQIYGSHADAANRCFGPDCFLVTMLTASALAACAIPLIVFVSWKYGKA